MPGRVAEHQVDRVAKRRCRDHGDQPRPNATQQRARLKVSRRHARAHLPLPSSSPNRWQTEPTR